MSELFINNNRACAVTGHRVLQDDFDRKSLKSLFIDLIDEGYDTFFIGMALGFDMLCFKVLEELSKEYKKVKLIACIPCAGQAYKYSKKQKEEYDRMVKDADEIVLISQTYTKTCMQKRNKFMVDNSSVLVAYLKRDFGGTANTVRYAKSINRKIIYI